MSAAYWRRAMNGEGRTDGIVSLPVPPGAARPSPAPAFDWIRGVRALHVVLMGALLVYPWIASPFFTFQVAGQALVLGLIALSLTFLAGYGGMVSLAQMTVAGMAGYAVAIFGSSATTEISLGWPWWVAGGIAVAMSIT